jgi:hypothetical protein
LELLPLLGINPETRPIREQSLGTFASAFNEKLRERLALNLGSTIEQSTILLSDS